MINPLLPKEVKKYVTALPENPPAEIVEKFRGLYGTEYVDSIIWTASDAHQALNEVGIRVDTSLYHFYLNGFELPNCSRSEELFGLAEVLHDYRDSFWGDRYDGFQERYLLLSSIEGEYSYFYDKVEDQVYGVGWESMKEFVQGSVAPLFSSSYQFLSWYYSEEIE
jgi:hypothetical protein